MIFDIIECEEIIGYTFKDKMLLRKCFTHSSYANENGGEDNERLEFFGDSIIQFVITEYLFGKIKADEGKLTEHRKSVVSNASLMKIVHKMGLSKHVLLGVGLKKHVEDDDKLYASLYEAIVAGIYLDGGLTATKKFIKNTIIPNIIAVITSAIILAISPP